MQGWGRRPVAVETQAVLGTRLAGDVGCGEELSQSITKSPICLSPSVHPGFRQWELLRAQGHSLGHDWCLSGSCSHHPWVFVSLPEGEMCVGCFLSPGLSLVSATVRPGAVLRLGWNSSSSLQPASSPGCSCLSLLTCFKSFPALTPRC